MRNSARIASSKAATFGPENKAAAGENFVELRPNRLSERAILFAEIEQGYAHGCEKDGSFARAFNGKFGLVHPR